MKFKGIDLEIQNEKLQAKALSVLKRLSKEVLQYFKPFLMTDACLPFGKPCFSSLDSLHFEVDLMDELCEQDDKVWQGAIVEALAESYLLGQAIRLGTPGKFSVSPDVMARSWGFSVEMHALDRKRLNGGEEHV